MGYSSMTFFTWLMARQVLLKGWVIQQRERKTVHYVFVKSPNRWKGTIYQQKASQDAHEPAKWVEPFQKWLRHGGHLSRGLSFSGSSTLKRVGGAGFSAYTLVGFAPRKTKLQVFFCPSGEYQNNAGFPCFSRSLLSCILLSTDS